MLDGERVSVKVDAVFGLFDGGVGDDTGIVDKVSEADALPKSVGFGGGESDGISGSALGGEGAVDKDFHTGQDIDFSAFEDG